MNASPQYSAELVFPLHNQHNHAPGIVECPNGDLLVSWYRGSGERSADDVAVFGARKKHGETAWSEAFLMADTPGFPDCNTCMMIDRQERLWLFWPAIHCQHLGIVSDQLPHEPRICRARLAKLGAERPGPVEAKRLQRRGRGAARRIDGKIQALC